MERQRIDLHPIAMRWRLLRRRPVLYLHPLPLHRFQRKLAGNRHHLFTRPVSHRRGVLQRNIVLPDLRGQLRRARHMAGRRNILRAQLLRQRLLQY